MFNNSPNFFLQQHIYASHIEGINGVTLSEREIQRSLTKWFLQAIKQYIKWRLQCTSLTTMAVFDSEVAGI